MSFLKNTSSPSTGREILC